jgi:hypothetical protein
MTQQTAVEWFHKETWKLKIKLEKQEISIGEYAVIYGELFERAKQMEQEQLKEMYLKGIENYDPTFKKKSQWTKVEKKQD